MIFRPVFQSSYRTGGSCPSPVIAVLVGNRPPPIDSPRHRPVNYPYAHSAPFAAGFSTADTGRNPAPCRSRIDGLTDGRKAVTVRRFFHRADPEMKWTSAGKVRSDDDDDERRLEPLSTDVTASTNACPTNVHTRPTATRLGDETKMDGWMDGNWKRRKTVRAATHDYRQRWTKNTGPRMHQRCSDCRHFQLLGWQRQCSWLVGRADRLSLKGVIVADSNSRRVVSGERDEK